MTDRFVLHDAARIRTGKYSGLVGTVTETRQEGERQTHVRVKVEGAKDGEAIAAHVWLRRSQVGRNHGA